MDINTLREYWNIVLDLEKNILLRKQLIKDLTKDANKLGIRRVFTEPTKPQEWLPPAEPQSSYEIHDEPVSKSFGCLGGLLWLPTYLVISLVVEAIAGDDVYLVLPFLILVSLVIAYLLTLRIRKYIAFRARVRQELEAIQSVSAGAIL